MSKIFDSYSHNLVTLLTNFQKKKNSNDVTSSKRKKTIEIKCGVVIINNNIYIIREEQKREGRFKNKQEGQGRQTTKLVHSNTTQPMHVRSVSVWCGMADDEDG